nr:endonuclease NucS [Melioribacteraceae bacterium]
MRERDLQDYLYNNPEILFPGKNIQEKTKEYYIKGKRIDLLFVIDGRRYIVELKAIPLEREHIGQVVEYYGLMKEYLNETNLKMILVAQSIPRWRSIFLEELGIQCVEINDIPESSSGEYIITKKVIANPKQLDKLNEYEQSIGPNEGFVNDDFEPVITSRKLA